MPREIKIRVWKMSNQMNVFFSVHVPWNGKVSELALVSITNWNPTGLSLGHRGQWLFPKDLSASLLLFIHSPFFISWLKNINSKL